MGKNDQMLVIGLGRFGRAIAQTLGSLGQEVLGVDASARIVQSCAASMTHVVQADSTDVEALRQLGAGDFPSAVVAIGSDIQASILTTYALVDLQIPRIWAKAITIEHGAILSRVGAHRVIFPERDMGVRMAHSMVGRTIDYIEIDGNFVLLETTAPREAIGKTLENAQIRRRHAVTVVCVKSPGGSFTYATPDTVLNADDLLVVAGSPDSAEAFAALD